MGRRLWEINNHFCCSMEKFFGYPS